MANLFNKAKVAQLDSGLFLDKHILGLDVSMEEAVAVDVVQG